MQLKNGVADCGAHQAHLSLPSFVYDDFQHRVSALLACLCDERRGCRFAFYVDALAKFPQSGQGDLTSNNCPVFFFDAIPRVSEPESEFAVIGEEQQPRRISIEAANREDSHAPRLQISVTEQIEDGGAAMSVFGCGHNPRRLVEHDVYKIGLCAGCGNGYRLAVDHDLVNPRAGPLPHLRHNLAVDTDTARRD